MSETFGFTINGRGNAFTGYDENDDGTYGERWQVSLPHQCGDWMIGKDWGEVAKEEVIETLTEFIHEAMNALTALKDAPETAPEDGWEWTTR